MNIRIVRKIIGASLLVEAVLMLLPLASAWYYDEDMTIFVWPILIAVAVGLLMYLRCDKEGVMASREGFISTGLTWIALSLVGMLPYLISGAMTHPIDAFFETVSGFTTTGASVITNLEELPRSLRLWRCFMHWIGGMGILVFMAAIMHFASGSQMNLVKAESTGPIVSKLVPRAGSTAQYLYAIYTLFSFITFLALVMLRMPVYDSLCLTFSIAGTGGFGVLADSCASYTVAQQLVLGLAPLVFGVSFTLYFLLFIGKFGIVFRNEELRAYIIIYIGAVLLVFLDLLAQDAAYEGAGLNALHRSAFTVSTIMTTTGFAIDDCNLWPRFSQCILCVLMITGACAGSTGGGIKVSRLLIMGKAFKREMSQYLHPGQVSRIHMDGKSMDDSVVRATGIYCSVCAFIIMVSVLFIALDGKAWDSTITAVLAAFGNIGPGIGENGSMGSYAAFSNLSKVVLSIDMLLGRLEVYPVLALFVRKNWSSF